MHSKCYKALSATLDRWTLTASCMRQPCVPSIASLRRRLQRDSEAFHASQRIGFSVLRAPLMGGRVRGIGSGVPVHEAWSDTTMRASQVRCCASQAFRLVRASLGIPLQEAYQSKFGFYLGRTEVRPDFSTACRKELPRVSRLLLATGQISGNGPGSE